MDALVAMYRLAAVDPADAVIVKVDSVCTSPAIAMLKAFLHGIPGLVLHIEQPAPIDAQCTMLYRHRFRNATLVYVAYMTVDDAVGLQETYRVMDVRTHPGHAVEDASMQ